MERHFPAVLRGFDVLLRELPGKPTVTGPTRLFGAPLGLPLGLDFVLSQPTGLYILSEAAG